MAEKWDATEDEILDAPGGEYADDDDEDDLIDISADTEPEEGRYPAVFLGSKMWRESDGATDPRKQESKKVSRIMEYALTDGKFRNKKVSDWITVTEPDGRRSDSDWKVNRALAALGVEPEEVNGERRYRASLKTLVGRAVYLTLKKSTGRDGKVYTNINKVEAPDDEAVRLAEAL